jgi:hypothetical protein
MEESMARNKSKDSYVAKAMAQLVTGKTFTMAEFRDQLAGGNEQRALRMIQWMRAKEGIQFAITKTNRSIETIRVVNIAEMVAKLNTIMKVQATAATVATSARTAATAPSSVQAAVPSV